MGAAAHLLRPLRGARRPPRRGETQTAGRRTSGARPTTEPRLLISPTVIRIGAARVEVPASVRVGPVCANACVRLGCLTATRTATTTARIRRDNTHETQRDFSDVPAVKHSRDAATVAAAATAHATTTWPAVVGARRARVARAYLVDEVTVTIGESWEPPRARTSRQCASMSRCVCITSQRKRQT